MFADRSARISPTFTWSNGTHPTTPRIKSYCAANASSQRVSSKVCLVWTATVPLTPVPSPGTLAAGDVRAKLSADLAKQADVPAGPAQARYGELVYTNPNELAVGAVVDVADPTAFRQRVLGRHWQGGVQQYFGFGAPPPYTVEVDLYADAAGASDAVRTNDYATGFKAVTPPAKLGDETAAYVGYDAGAGSAELIWRRGRVVWSVWYYATAGQPGPDAALSVARTIDAHATPVP